MPAPATDTRRKLIDAATRSFAEDGIATASLLDITRKAGQRNRGALHYHFGSRDGVLVAVLEQPVAFLARRQAELFAVARATPADDVASVAEAMVRPALELAETGWRGRCYLVILAELVQEDPTRRSAGVRAALEATGGYPIYALLARRMAGVDEAVRQERISLVTTFMLRAVADRARAHERRDRGARRQLDRETFERNLIAMVTAMCTAPS